MSIINYASREIQFKIVYYGPALCGKTTNLGYIHQRISPENRGDLVSLATAADRTLFFDFLPVNAVVIKGFVTKFQLYTVPGQVIYNATRQLVLRSVDGVVFVADSQWEKMEENVESFKNLRTIWPSRTFRSTKFPTSCNTTNATCQISRRSIISNMC